MIGTKVIDQLIREVESDEVKKKDDVSSYFSGWVQKRGLGLNY